MSLMLSRDLVNIVPLEIENVLTLVQLFNKRFCPGFPIPNLKRSFWHSKGVTRRLLFKIKRSGNSAYILVLTLDSNSTYSSDFKQHVGNSVIRLYYRYRYVQLCQRTAICIGHICVICIVHRTNIKHKEQTYFTFHTVCSTKT